MAEEKMKLGGHRGMGCTDHDKYQVIRDVPNLPVENTVESVAAAFDAGADYVEIDAAQSADGVSFVLHNVIPKDHFFGADRPPQKLNLLKFEDFAQAKTGRYCNGAVAKMSDMLERIAAKDPKTLPWAVNIEIKGVQGSGQNYETNDFLDNLAKTVTKSPLDPRRILWSSFSLENIIRMSHAFPESSYGMLFAERNIGRAIYTDHQDEFSYRYLQFDGKSVDKILHDWKMRVNGKAVLGYMHPEILTVDDVMLDKMAQEKLGVNCWALFEKFDAERADVYKNVVRMATEKNVNLTVITDYLSEMKALKL